jgi:hypothetical protein
VAGAVTIINENTLSNKNQPQNEKRFFLMPCYISLRATGLRAICALGRKNHIHLQHKKKNNKAEEDEDDDENVSCNIVGSSPFGGYCLSAATFPQPCFDWTL